jgi:hypothetical protein
LPRRALERGWPVHGVVALLLDEQDVLALAERLLTAA